MPELTAEEAHAQAKERARKQRLTRLHATLDQNARARATAEIQSIVDRLVRDGGDVPVKILPTIRDRLPPIARDRTIAEVSPMIAEAHHTHGMTRDALGRWILDLLSVGKDLYAKRCPDLSRTPHPDVVRITRGAGPGILAEFTLPPLPPIRPALPPREPVRGIPEEDQAALFDLAP